MSTKTDNENTSPDTENRIMSADTSHDSSSAGTGSDHLFLETESKNASRETVINNPSVDMDSTDTPDTLTLARLDRENQGTWEAEYSYGGEADLHRYYDNCTKNPDHKNFIPVDKFNIEDLPEECRDGDVMDYIRAVSDLTVRVTVKYVSDKRPETGGVSGKHFPGYFYRGQRRTTVGTGWVDSVDVYHEDGRDTCRCKDCITSYKPQTEFGRINISTARHVVFDESEAAHTTCHLYFDRGGTPETCEGVVALTGMYCQHYKHETDHYKMYHYTHDLVLTHILDQRCKQRKDLKQRVMDKNSPYKWNLKCSRPALDKQPYLFIVSHPHGCSKQISIGRCHSLLALLDNVCGYTYTTATCRGSSGAAVHLLHAAVQYSTYWLFWDSTHHGVCDKQPGMNVFLLSQWTVFDEMESLQQVLQEEVTSKDIFYEENEDLRKHYDSCQHNPGHHNFFPVDKFSVDHLPPCKYKEEIMKLIEVLSHLTVRVSVRYVSEKRPETVPGTNIPYPWYKHRGSNRLRVGSGRITRVDCPIYGDCKCEECNNSDTPAARKFARIHIITASHLVYDFLEGKQSTCHLFFDSGETPNACKDVVTLTNAYRTVNETDKCRRTLKYCTHDLALAHKLRESVRIYNDLKREWDSYYCHEILKQDDKNNSTPNPPLNIVVSHPHGLAKHVSISYHGCRGNSDTAESYHPYNSIMCPGSVGASVFALRKQPLYPCFE